jgi:hypothetical protein
MIKFTVPGLGDYTIEHLVMDVNGRLVGRSQRPGLGAVGPDHPGQ